ncbi:MAG: (2Fe-2S) ferredoxin domain-containing protein [Methylococcales bacterium]|nr:(2Fe-2S) ferredoxin domain-containing protein [Methylococcales bacterium]
MSHYHYHVFMCSHERQPGQACCGQDGQALALLAYAKDGLKQRQQAGLVDKSCRINKSGCMDRCAEGPLLVIYPEGVWYRYQTLEDIDEILDHHLVQGQRVERLQLA